MESDEVKAICEERLGSWTQRLVDQHATPCFLLGIGHDHKSGVLLLCTLEDMSDTELLLFLRAAADSVAAQIIRRQ